MSHPAKMHRSLVNILSLSISFGLAVVPALGQGLPDVRKSALETPMKSLIRGNPSPKLLSHPANLTLGRADMGKMGIESPTKSLIRGNTLMDSLLKAPRNPKPERQAARLPELEDRTLGADKVKPGRIEWHSTFQKAMAASARSGKPVFLFHMMGRLDDRFC